MRQPWDSIVSVEVAEEGTTLSWMNRTGIYSPWVMVPIQLVALIGWLLWIFLCMGLMYSVYTEPGPLSNKLFWFTFLFLMFAYATLLIVSGLYFHFTRKVPETVTLRDARLEYKPGGAYTLTPSIRTYFRRVFLLFRPKHRFQMTRSDLREVTIEQDFFGPSRLVLDGGRRRIRCGDCLPQRDQVWLAATLNEWCAGENG